MNEGDMNDGKVNDVELENDGVNDFGIIGT